MNLRLTWGPAGHGDHRPRLSLVGVERVDSGIGIGNEVAGKASEMALGMVGRAVGPVEAGCRRRCVAVVRPLVAHVDPQPPGLGLGAAGAGDHQDGRLVALIAGVMHCAGRDEQSIASVQCNPVIIKLLVDAARQQTNTFQTDLGAVRLRDCARLDSHASDAAPACAPVVSSTSYSIFMPTESEVTQVPFLASRR